MVFKVVVVAAFVALGALFGCQSVPLHPASEHFDGEQFANVPQAPPSADQIDILKRFFLADSVPGRVPVDAIPWQKVDWSQWAALPSNDVHVMRLGHSSLLLKIAGHD